MCNYREENKCKIENNICPWVYWCDKINGWKELEKAPKQCNLINSLPAPKGSYKVVFERHGYLYVQIDNQVIKLKNIFDYVPQFVKVSKYKGNYKIKKEE